ncbi:hypothetical protein [Oscillibacter ruminantium]|uniref:hypothetical protein n=1 Tax=Oscillibacter ruminantium TaxID=1263547 RepID=UPI0025AA6B22|nr:hypothetical protein [Oscillibacter ruminantium]MDN0031824.1 hypothetical protein [Oscillibacter valericigenes]MEA5040940.1 hypothetical protein [Oscillibacter ruminantium]
MAAAAARTPRYNHRSATYGDLAYDLDRELRERQLSHAGELPRRREETVAEPRVRSVTHAKVRERQHVSFFTVLGFLAVAGLAVMTLLCHVQLTGLSSDVVSLNKELRQLQTENVSLTAEYAQMFDLDTVKEAAESAGMAKPSSGQTYYMDLSDGDCAVVYQKRETGLLERVVTSLNHGVYAVVEYFG